MTTAFRWVALPLFAVAALGAPCKNAAELLKHDHMNLGAQFEIADPKIVREFEHALNFWSKILDMEWHTDLESTCSIDVIDSTPDFIDGPAEVRTQKSIARGIKSSGIVAIDSTYKLSAAEWYAVAVHELGHLFGLQHNSDANSVMYYMSVPGDQALDATDIAALSAAHRMRIRLNFLQP